MQVGGLQITKVNQSPRNNRRTAIIDVGSNSIRLVVYQGPARVPAILFNEKVMAGLGKELATSGAIAADSMVTAISALKRFHRLCLQMEVDSIESFATAAVRDASNGGELLEAAAKIGIETQVLEGEEEAELAGLGVISAVPGAHGIVGDLGGGSLELAMISNGEVLERHSFPLGVLRISELRSKGKDKLKRYVRKMLKKRGGTNRRRDCHSTWLEGPGVLSPGLTCSTAGIRFPSFIITKGSLNEPDDWCDNWRA